MMQRDTRPDFAAGQLRRDTLPHNTRGRDFVVGDLHGCFLPLRRALEAVDFDPERDRLISVGDLVDRGPDSLACLGLLEQPWFHAVMGNHEAAMLAHAGAEQEGGSPEAAWLHLGIGGDWLDECWPPHEHSRLPGLLRRAAELPHLLQVGTGPGRYHVVHAQLPLGMLGGTWTDQRLDADWQSLDPATLVWSRRLFHGSRLPRREWQRGLSPVFCGHTPGDGVRTRLSHVCLDTGLVYGWTGRWESAAIALAEPGPEGVTEHVFEVREGTFLGRST